MAEVSKRVDQTKKKRMQSWITVSVFCILIFGFSIATLVKPSAEFSETENRVLRQMPEIKTAAILSGDFESDYE